jgi:tetratricopeptide (TPR) repeat protein
LKSVELLNNDPIANINLGFYKSIIYTNLAWMKCLLHQNQEALTYYKDALTINPRHTRALYSRASLLRSMHRYSEALEDFSKCMTIFENRLEALKDKLASQVFRGDERKELNIFLMKTRSRISGLLEDSGLTYLETNQLEKAKIMFLKSIELTPRESYYSYLILSNIALRIGGNINLAFHLLDNGINLCSKNTYDMNAEGLAQLYDYRAEIKSTFGNVEEAKSDRIIYNQLRNIERIS